VTQPLTSPPPAVDAPARPAPSGLVHAAPPATPRSVLMPRTWLVLALGLALAALATSAAVGGGSVLLTLDEPIQRAVESRRTSALNDVFLGISRLGSTVVVLAVGTAASIVTWRRCRAVSIAVLIATFSRPALEFVVKAVVGRDRPEFERLVDGTGPSFPSGHVMAAVALWGLMPLVVSLYTRRRAIWWASVVIAGGLIVAIAASRVYLGVHWFSDVTAGLIVGGFFLLAVDVLLSRQHARHPCRLLPAPAPPSEMGADVGPDAANLDDELAELTEAADVGRPLS
jgi:undecaprenyl-diphosphatase